jgi:hypothetical protein
MPRLLCLAALLLLLAPPRPAHAGAADGQAAAHLVGGVALTGVGAAFIPIGVELGIRFGPSPSLASFVGSGGMLLGAGIPALFVGLKQLSRSPDENSRLGMARMHLEFARPMVPIWTTVGAIGGTLGLVLGVELASNQQPSAGAWVLMASGYALMGTAIPLARRADVATRGLNRGRRPWRGWLATSVPLLITGAVGLVVVGPIARIAQVSSGDDPVAVPVLLVASGLLVTGGVVGLVAGMVESRRMATGPRRPGAVVAQVQAVVPWLEPDRGGLAVVGTW